MRSSVLMIAVSIALGGDAVAQSPGGPPSERTAPSEKAVTCPPDVKGEPPTVGSGSSKSLSDRLADSKGVICPPSGVDQDIQVRPPGGGQLKVIPPPGTPGGDQNIQPK